MTLPQGVVTIGPHNGSVHLRTAREGFASSVGHDLVIGFGRWAGDIVVGASPADIAITVDIEVASLEVIEGSGGVAPITDADRADIRGNALRVLDAARSPVATFRSTRVSPSGQDGVHGTIEGELTLHGTTRPLSLTAEASSPGHWRARGAVRQTEFGIKPYKAFFGALRLADRVGIEVDVTIDPDFEHNEAMSR